MPEERSAVIFKPEGLPAGISESAARVGRSVEIVGHSGRLYKGVVRRREYGPEYYADLILDGEEGSVLIQLRFIESIRDRAEIL